MGSDDSVWMTSPNIKPGQPGYYHELVYDDVQMSDSGEYMHQSPGGLWCLGHENCSHACVRMTAAGAFWWRHTAYRGDPVTITGTPRVLAWDNGWSYWQKSWSAWLRAAPPGQSPHRAGRRPAPRAPAFAGPKIRAPISAARLSPRVRVCVPCARKVFVLTRTAPLTGSRCALHSLGRPSGCRPQPSCRRQTSIKRALGTPTPTHVPASREGWIQRREIVKERPAGISFRDAGKRGCM